MATRRARTSSPAPRRSPRSKSASSDSRPPADGAASDEGARDDLAEGGAKGVPRALWTGSLGFGLLQIPVSLHTASATQELRFHQLDARTHDPIGYKRVNKVSGDEVEWEHIVRGYEVDKGEYVVITDEDLKAADVEATQSIDVLDFVDRDAIQPIWFDKPYYLAPTKRAERAYALFREALVRTGKVAIAKVVIRTRQHLAMVYPSGRALVLEILRWAHELRSPRGLDLPSEDLSELKVSDREMEMAEELIERMSSDWNPSRYRDEYREAVLAMIEEKARSGKVTEVRHPKAEGEAPQRTADLVALLRKSLDHTGAERPAGTKTKGGGKKGRSAA